MTNPPLDIAGLIKRLRYMARQYTNGQIARGGAPRKHFLDEAADALAALSTLAGVPREPTTAMLNAARLVTPRNNAAIWRAMYDAALAERQSQTNSQCADTKYVELTQGEAALHHPAPEREGEIAARERLEPEGGLTHGKLADAQNDVTRRRDGDPTPAPATPETQSDLMREIEEILDAPVVDPTKTTRRAINIVRDVLARARDALREKEAEIARLEGDWKACINSLDKDEADRLAAWERVDALESELARTKPVIEAARAYVKSGSVLDLQRLDDAIRAHDRAQEKP